MFVCAGLIDTLFLFWGGPADGKILPGDQIFAINNENVENIHVQKAADMVR